ncbi:MAG: hypothetical protein IKC22_06445 [Bacilli bacterium]|nr:hypothetical protein [Bacilli bacterium]
MNVEWFSNDKEKIATIYENNITFNTVASNYFKDIYSTLIGYDIENNVLLVKPVSKDDVTTRNIPSEELHSVSIKPSYGRINGKNIIKKLCNYFPINFSLKKAYRYMCEWSNEEKLLKIYLTKEVK